MAEMPSGTDEVHGLLSTDYSGLEFWRLARETGLRREEIHVTAAMLCRPKRVKKEAPVAAYACAGRLAEELRGIDPAVPIVPLGTIAESILTGHGNIAKGRGFVWAVPVAKRKSPPKLPDPGARTFRAKLLAHAQYVVRSTLQGRTCLPTLDPRQVMRAQPTWLPLIGIDLKRMRRFIDGRGARPLDDVGEQTVCRTAEELSAALTLWALRGGGHIRFGREVVVDVETAGKDALHTPLQMVGICDVATGHVVQAYPWRSDMAPIVTAFLRDRTVVWHNGESFDAVVLERHGVELPAARHDTLVMHHAMASHLRQSLDHCVSNYCDSGPWKLKHRGQTADDKGGFGVRPEELPVYNGADVRLNALLWKRMNADISDADRRVYETDLRLAEIAKRMRVRGLAVDETRRQALIKACREREEALLAELRDAVGDVKFEPSKAAHIRGVLYRNRKARSWTPTGEASTDKGALEAMSRQGDAEGRVAKLVLDWRRARDARAEYLEALQVNNGRVHASWRIPGTDTGRDTCTGPNFLNMPRIPHCRGCGIAMLDRNVHATTCAVSYIPSDPSGQIRDIYVAQPGHVFVYHDLSQAEMRFAAHIYADGPMMQACERDVHQGNAAVIFPEHAEVILSDPKGRGKPYRDIAKNIGFAIAYQAGAGTVHAYLLAHGFPDVTCEAVEKMLARLHVVYKHFYAWVDFQYRWVKRYGFLRTVWSGRKRTFGRFRVSKPEVSNYHMQAGVADIMNGTILTLDKVMPCEAHLVFYQYDSLIYEVPAALADEVRSHIVEHWAKPLVVPAWPASGMKEISFVQPVDIHVGERLSEL